MLNRLTTLMAKIFSKNYNLELSEYSTNKINIFKIYCKIQMPNNSPPIFVFINFTQYIYNKNNYKKVFVKDFNYKLIIH